jgi:hypothetical protein
MSQGTVVRLSKDSYCNMATKNGIKWFLFSHCNTDFLLELLTTFCKYFLFYDLQFLHNHLRIISSELKAMANITVMACFQASTQHLPERTGKNLNPSNQYSISVPN